MRECQHESSIEISKAQEVVKLCQHHHGWTILNDLYLSWIHMHTFLINNVTHILDLAHAKGAFSQVSTQRVLSQSVKNLSNILQVLFSSLVEDEDIIKIYNHQYVGERPQDVIHQPHESCGGIRQIERHDQPIEKTLHGLESGLPHIYGFYQNLVIIKLKIYIIEVFGPLEMVQKVINLWNWVPVLKYDFFQGPIINGESQGSILLLHEYNWAPTR